uniref:C2H2-type domain-containing protein n=1 Tax=Panagrolaimus sp. ES5 TaxID=591445 RepID=A0AC34F3A2_9BILA
MATKDEYLSDKLNIDFGVTSRGQYRNLNLYLNYQRLHHETHLKRIAAVITLSDFTESTDLKAKKDSYSWNKSSKHLSTSFLNFHQKSEEQHEFKESKNTNKSTLSLHIAAYENLVEDDKDDSKRKKKRVDKTSKLVFTGSSSFITHSFEFPRQQEEDRSNYPEVMQFKASQRLRNPNEENFNVNESNNTISSSLLRQPNRTQITKIMNIENGVPYSSTQIYNPFYPFSAPQTLPFFNNINNGKDNGTAKICVACAEGMYCAVAASLIVFSTAFHDPNPQRTSMYGNGSDKSGESNESPISNESIIRREIQNEIAAANAAASAASSMLTIPEHHEEIFPKREPFTVATEHHHYHQHQYQGGVEKKRRERKPQKNKIVPNLDENGIRKRYSRFRSKNHVCDFCNKSFTLKQNVQTHMSLYHMCSDPVQRTLAVRKTIKKREAMDQQ